MITKKDKNPKGVEIRFDEDEHKYVTDNVQDFTSVTTLVGKYFRPFDTEEISKRYALKHGKDQDEIKALWKREGDLACELGSNVHLYGEQLMLNNPNPIKPRDKNMKEVILFSVMDDVIKMLKEQFEFIGSEKIVFSEKYKIAGMIDLLLKKDDIIFLVDFKTSKKVDQSNPFQNYGTGPLKNMADNNFNHFSIQLNTYRWLLLEEKYYDCKICMFIIHLNMNGYDLFSVDDMQETIMKLI